MTKPKNSPAIDMAALAVLGLDPKEIEEKVIERIADRFLQGYRWGEDGERYTCDSAFRRKLDERITGHVDQTINALAEVHILPNVAAYIENLTLQKTNKWGERTGQPMTFIEYLVERCEAYMKEEVNHDGKSREQDGYSFRAYGTRIAYMVDKHLHWSISQAMEAAFKDANSMIVGGLKKAMDVSLDNIKNSLKVTTEVKRT